MSIMRVETLAASLGRRGIHYAWVMVGLTFLVSVSSAGAMGALGALILPIQGEFGWGLSTISGALALRLLLFGIMAPFAAALMQRYGLRRIVVLALILVVAGSLLSLSMHASWQLWLSWGVLTGIGSGMTALVLGATVATRWFSARRGLVLGILTAANATGQLAFLPLAAWLAENQGWRMALLPGLAACGVSAALIALLGRDHPHQLGLAPFGETALAAAPARPAGNPVRTAFATLAEASGTRTFWVLFATFLICGLSTNGLIQTHFIPLCFDFGMKEVEAASVLAMMGAFDFVGTIGSGWLSDRYEARKLLFWYYGLRGISLLILPNSVFSLAGLSIFAVFYGLDWIATVPPTAKMAAQAFGQQRAPIVFGWVFTAHQLGAAIAAYGAGMSREALASYVPAFYTAGLACIGAALIVISLAARPALARAVR